MRRRGLAILGRTHREKDYSKRRGSGFEREREREREREGAAKTRVTGFPGEGPPIVGNPKSTIQIDCEPNSR